MQEAVNVSLGNLLSYPFVRAEELTTISSKAHLRREEKIRFGDENAVDGETGNIVVRDDDRVSGEESREARERLQETEIGEGETLRNDVISDGETTTVGGG
ncbi:hypothetical protein Bca4012_040934 [Brassica carinata]